MWEELAAAADRRLHLTVGEGLLDANAGRAWNWVGDWPGRMHTRGKDAGEKCPGLHVRAEACALLRSPGPALG